MKRISILAIATSLLPLMSLSLGKGKNKPPVETPPVSGMVAQGTKPVWLDTLVSSGGRLDDAVFSAFIADCKRHVLADIASRHVTLDPAFVKAIEADRDIHDGTFASIYPADPRVLENMQRLWKELGPVMFHRFRHLSLGVSIMRREYGLGGVVSPPENFKNSMFYSGKAQKADANDAEVEVAGKKSKGSKSPKLTATMIASIDKFKATQGNATLDVVWKTPEMRAAITKELGSQSVPAEAVVGVLKQYLVAKKIQPEKRSNTPIVSDYIKALAKRLDTPAPAMHFETKEALHTRGDRKHVEDMKWPLFPADKAPWPVLMGLGMTWPLDESQFVFEKLQGLHPEDGKDVRIHTYGPYQGGELSVIASLREVPWADAAWPQLINIGGSCGTMSSIGVGTYLSLGVPAFKCGQPGHSCMLTYRVNQEGFYYARVEQAATAGPTGTHTDWPFQDNSHPRTHFADCHYGMALAMNKGLSNWFRTRIAVHFYLALSAEQQKTLGRTILRQAIALNPFNAEPWYYLADMEKDWPGKKSLLEELHKVLKGDMPLSTVLLKEAGADLGREKHEEQTMMKNVVVFRSLVRDVMLVNYLSNPAALKPTERQELLGMIKGWSAQPSHEMAAIQLRYEFGSRDPNAVKKELSAQVLAACATPYEKDEDKQTEKSLDVKLQQLQYVLANRDEREKFLMDLLTSVPVKDAYYKGKKFVKRDKITARPCIGTITGVLKASLQQEPRRKEEEAKLKQLEAKWEQAARSDAKVDPSALRKFGPESAK